MNISETGLSKIVSKFHRQQSLPHTANWWTLVNYQRSSIVTTHLISTLYMLP